MSNPVPQTVDYGANATVVEAVPETGHHFVRWERGGLTYSTEALLTVTGVTADITLTAEFEINSYTVTFTAGANGSLTGATPQTVAHGGDTSAIAAVPATGYRFSQWLLDGVLYSTDNPLTVTTVTADMALSVEFELDVFTVTFTAGANGGISGTAPQDVQYGHDSDPVEAVPDTGHHFVRWVQDGALYSTDNPLTVTNVIDTMAVTAEFAITTYAVTFAAGANGSVEGALAQTVAHGGNADAVTAEGTAGYVFDRWLLAATEYSGENPLTVTSVTADMALTAIFREALPVDLDGEFVLTIPDGAFATGLAVWDLSGHYDADLGDDALTLELQHDTKGKITGNGAYLTDLPGKAAYEVPLEAKGGGKGKDGTVLVKLGLKGAAVGIPSDPAAKAKISVKQTLTLDVGSSTLLGPASVSTAFGKEKDKFTTNVTMGLPPGMDGTYDVALDLACDGKKVTGTGVLVLSNGVSYPLIVKAKVKDGVTSLAISGDKADPAAGGIKLKVSVETLEDGSARVLSLSGKAFGQSIYWAR